MLPAVSRKFVCVRMKTLDVIHYEWAVIAGNVRDELILIPRYMLIICRETEKEDELQQRGLDRSHNQLHGNWRRVGRRTQGTVLTGSAPGRLE